jgi:hypothetical protein
MLWQMAIAVPNQNPSIYGESKLQQFFAARNYGDDCLEYMTAASPEL